MLYAVIMMGCFNFYSHGTGDLYPLFLQREHGLKPAQVGQIAILYNIGGVLGCWLFGPVSQHLGRRKTMIVAALMGVPVIYFWAFSPYVPVLTVGAILINFFVQGCWSIMPAHLNELSPAGARGTFPGTMYQLGNLLASSNLTLQAIIAEKYSYGIALASVALLATIAIIGMILIGPEAHNAEMKKAG